MVSRAFPPGIPKNNLKHELFFIMKRGRFPNKSAPFLFLRVTAPSIRSHFSSPISVSFPPQNPSLCLYSSYGFSSGETIRSIPASKSEIPNSPQQAGISIP